MRYPRLFLFLFALILQLQGSAQDIATDSKGKGVFSMYGIQKVRFDFSHKDFTSTIRLYKDTVRYLKVLGDTISTIDTANVTKTYNWFLQLSMLNAANIVSLTDLSNFRPGGRIRLGYQINPDTISTDYTGYSYSFGISTFVSVDNFLHYDPALGKEFHVRNPWSYGIEANLTWFLPEWLSERWIVMALNGSLSRGWNDNSLLNFKERDQAIIDPNVVAFDKFTGKYGELKTDVNRARAAISFPIKIAWVKDTRWFRWMQYYSPTPYGVVNYSNGTAPLYIAGIYNNVFADKLTFNKFEVPSSFGLGVDWYHTEGKWSSPNWFIRGSLSFK